VVHGLLMLISPVRHSTRGGQRQQPVYIGIVVNNYISISLLESETERLFLTSKAVVFRPQSHPRQAS
jgi:hypothetical protein